MRKCDAKREGSPESCPKPRHPQARPSACSTLPSAPPAPSVPMPAPMSLTACSHLPTDLGMTQTKLPLQAAWVSNPSNDHFVLTTL